MSQNVALCGNWLNDRVENIRTRFIATTSLMIFRDELYIVQNHMNLFHQCKIRELFVIHYNYVWLKPAFFLTDPKENTGRQFR